MRPSYPFILLLAFLATACNVLGPAKSTTDQQHDKDGPCASKPCDEEGAEELIDLYDKDMPGMNDLRVFKVKGHIIQYKNEPLGISETTLRDAIKELNTNFAGAKIKFVLQNSISSQSFSYYLSDIRSNHVTEKELTTGLERQKLINLYLVRTNSLLEGYTPVLSSGFEDYKQLDLNKLFLSHRAIQRPATVAHEFGHFFNLQHTFGDNPTEGSTNEAINGSNCLTAGDFICDTPADPNGQQDCCDCSYQGTLLQTNKNYNPLTNNFMSYYKYCCRTEFTPGQLKAMKMAALEYRDYLQ